MNKDEYFEAQEHQYKDACEKLICKDAAIFIGYPECSVESIRDREGP